MTFHLADIDFAFADQAVNDRRISDSTSDDSAALAAICFGPNVSKASPSGHVEGRACVVDWRRAIAEQCHSTAGACDSSKVLSKVVDDAQDTRPIVAIRVELDAGAVLGEAQSRAIKVDGGLLSNCQSCRVQQSR